MTPGQYEETKEQIKAYEQIEDQLSTIENFYSRIDYHKGNVKEDYVDKGMVIGAYWNTKGKEDFSRINFPMSSPITKLLLNLIKVEKERLMSERETI